MHAIVAMILEASLLAIDPKRDDQAFKTAHRTLLTTIQTAVSEVPNDMITNELVKKNLVLTRIELTALNNSSANRTDVLPAPSHPPFNTPHLEFIRRAVWQHGDQLRLIGTTLLSIMNAMSDHNKISAKLVAQFISAVHTIRSVAESFRTVTLLAKKMLLWPVPTPPPPTLVNIWYATRTRCC
jgi:hypothetical protein